MIQKQGFCSNNAPRVCLVASPAQTSTSAGPHILLVLDQITAVFRRRRARPFRRLAELLPERGYRVLHSYAGGRSWVRFFCATRPCPVYLFTPASHLEICGRFWAARSFAAVSTPTAGGSCARPSSKAPTCGVGSVARTVPGTKLIWSRRDMGIFAHVQATGSCIVCFAVCRTR